MNKKVRNAGIVAMILAVCMLVGGIVDFFIPDIIGESLKGDPLDVWMFIMGVSPAINWLLIGMFICVYIPCAVIGTYVALSSQMAIFMLFLIPMVLGISLFLWPLVCLGIIILIPTFID